MKNITKLYLIVSILIWGISAQAQSLGHHHSSPSAENKNVYVAMMDTMMVKMDQIPPIKSIEADFMWQMIPHHQGAIAMAKYQIANGKSFEIIQLAKSILAEQQIDIQNMNLRLEKISGESADIPKNYSLEMLKTMNVMMENMPDNERLGDLDRSFAMVMIPHHQAAIDMAMVILKYSMDVQTKAFAKQLIAAEEIEIEQMKSFLK